MIINLFDLINKKQLTAVKLWGGVDYAWRTMMWKSADKTRVTKIQESTAPMCCTALAAHYYLNVSNWKSPIKPPPVKFFSFSAVSKGCLAAICFCQDD